jgi:hypothetical protein
MTRDGMSRTLTAITRQARPLALAALLGAPTVLIAAPAEEAVVFKILAVNPSETETKDVSIRGVLPPEVKAENVVDADGLEVEYDSQLGAYVVKGTVPLRPKGSVIKNILIEDVWLIPEAQFARLEQEVAEILEKLQGTTLLERGQIMADAIQRRLRELRGHQAQPFLNPEAHISRYRDDVKALQLVESELVSLRQLMVMAALEPSQPAAIVMGDGGEAAGGAGHERGSLSILTTWKLIFVILGLLAVVSLSFFLVWQRQLKTQLAKQPPAGAGADEDELLTGGNGRGESPTASAPPPAPPA